LECKKCGYIPIGSLLIDTLFSSVSLPIPDTEIEEYFATQRAAIDAIVAPDSPFATNYAARRSALSFANGNGTPLLFIMLQSAAWQRVPLAMAATIPLLHLGVPWYLPGVPDWPSLWFQVMRAASRLEKEASWDTLPLVRELMEYNIPFDGYGVGDLTRWPPYTTILEAVLTERLDDERAGWLAAHGASIDILKKPNNVFVDHLDSRMTREQWQQSLASGMYLDVEDTVGKWCFFFPSILFALHSASALTIT
jgi:hypothetical protein